MERAPNDKPRSGRPVEVAIVEKIPKLVLKIVRDNAGYKISNEHVGNILHILYMRMLCAEWMLRMLTFEHHCTAENNGLQPVKQLQRTSRQFCQLTKF